MTTIVLILTLLLLSSITLIAGLVVGNRRNSDAKRLLEVRDYEISKLIERNKAYTYMLELFKQQYEYDVKVGFCAVLNSYNAHTGTNLPILDLPELLKYKPKEMKYKNYKQEYWFKVTAYDKNVSTFYRNVIMKSSF